VAPLESARIHKTATRRTALKRRWGWVLVLVAGVVFFGIDREVYALTHNPNLIPGLLLVGASILPATFVVSLMGQRLRVDVPAIALISVAAATGALAVAASGLIEYHTLEATDHLPAITIAVIEETTKLLIPAVLLTARKWRRPINGLVIGVAAGGGFAVMETLGYSAVTLLNSHASVINVENVLLIRSIFTPMTHMAWTGLTTAGLWWAVARRGKPQAIAWAIGIFALAVALHTAWDSFHTIGTDIALATITLAALTLAIRRLEHREHARR
jgi:RsiW-degrading membrane proteinase PrsW (M82 family)